MLRLLSKALPSSLTSPSLGRDEYSCVKHAIIGVCYHVCLFFFLYISLYKRVIKIYFLHNLASIPKSCFYMHKSAWPGLNLRQLVMQTSAVMSDYSPVSKLLPVSPLSHHTCRRRPSSPAATVKFLGKRIRQHCRLTQGSSRPDCVDHKGCMRSCFVESAHREPWAHHLVTRLGVKVSSKGLG